MVFVQQGGVERLEDRGLARALERLDAAGQAEVRHLYESLRGEIELLSSELLTKEARIRELTSHAERTRRLTAMGDLAAAIAHRVRSPLGTINLYSSLLERELTADTDHREMARQISQEVQRLDLILNNLLLFARELRPAEQPVALHELLRTALRDAEPLISGCRLTIQAELTADPDLVAGDPHLLRQLFLNLILNAVQAMDERGVLSLHTFPLEGDAAWVRIEIADTGEGIAPEDLDKIFNPFYTTRNRGAGLGLTISHNIVEAHGGTLQVRSRRAGGTVVGLALPRLRQSVD